VLVQEEDPERLDSAAADGVAAHRVIPERHPLPAFERPVEADEKVRIGLRPRGQQPSVSATGRIHRQIARQLPDRRLGMLGEGRIAQLPDPRGGVRYGGQLLGLEAEGRERAVAVRVLLSRLRPALGADGEVGEIEVAGLEPVAEGLSLRGLDRLDRHPESPQLVLVALEHPAPGIVRPAAGIGGDVADQLVERDVVVPAEEGGEEIDPALDLGGRSRQCHSSAYCIR
jgi:hypothetical protein